MLVVTNTPSKTDQGQQLTVFQTLSRTAIKTFSLAFNSQNDVNKLWYRVTNVSRDTVEKIMSKLRVVMFY